MICYLPYHVAAQAKTDGHAISVQLIHCPDTVLFLNHYAANGISNDDTATIQNGTVVFKGSDQLDNGLYFVSSKKRFTYFEFILNNKQVLDFSMDCSDFYRTLKTSDVELNGKFFMMIAALKENCLANKIAPTDSLEFLLDKADYSQPKMQKLFNRPFSDMSLGEKYLKCCISPSKFQHSFLLNGKENKLSRYYLDHYFDNLDFSDTAMISLPAFGQRIDQFVDTLNGLPTVPAKPEVDRLISLAGANKRMQQFVVYRLETRFDSYYFRQGYDALYIHLIDDYLMKGKVAWYYPDLKQRELAQVKKRRPLLDGSMASDIEMPDSSGVSHNLFGTKAKYTLLLFWASTCSHCREEMPGILSFYREFHNKYDLEIFAVSTDTSTVRWKNFIRKKKLPWINVFGRKSTRGNYHELYNVQITPTMFLLDEQKRIIAKYLKPEKFGELIKERERSEKSK